MVFLGRLVGTIWFFLSKTQLRLITVEGAARLSMRGAGMICKEISMYRAYQARKLASASGTNSLKLSTPRRSHLLFDGKSDMLDSSTSESLHSWSRRWALVGVTATQLAVAHQWLLEESEEKMEDAEAGDMDEVGLAVNRAVLLDDFLSSTASVLESPDLDLEFWEDFAQDFHT